MKIYLGLLLYSLVILLGQKTASAKPLAEEVQEEAAIHKKQNPVLVDKDGDKLSDGLQASMAGMEASDSIDVIVTFKGIRNNQPNVVTAEKAIGAFRLHREFTIIYGFKASMTVAQAQALARIPNVFRVEEEVVVTTQLIGASSDFGAITARENFAVNGQDIGICIVDTGIDPNHEQFSGRNIIFFDAINGLATPYDDHGHGTHVAGIALGGGGSGVYTNVMGIAPAASIFSAKVLDASGIGNSEQVIAGIEFCAAQADVDIISMSLGSAGSSDGLDSESMAVNCASDPFYNATCNNSNNPKIVVVAAGNNGPEPQTVGSPGAAVKALTAGAVANFTENGRGVYLGAFSSRGPTLDGRIKPDISAPGVRILSALAGTINGYANASGTSMATPYTSGAIALMLQSSPAIMNDAIPADEVRNLLSDSAQDRGRSSIKPDNEYGAGVIDVKLAVALASGAAPTATALPTYIKYEGSINGIGGVQNFGPFEISETDITNDIGISATVTIDGDVICTLFIPDFNICLNYSWRPDLDVSLLDNNGNIVAGAAGDITESICPLDGEFCGLGRQETIHYKPIFPSAAGNYTIQVYSFEGTGDFLLEVSKGPMYDGTSPPLNNDPVASFTETCNDLFCSFTDTSTDDGTIDAWAWDFGDGNQSTSQHPAYTFSAAGIFTVTLTVTNDQGVTNTTSHAVSVTEQPSSNVAPVADAGGPYDATINKGKNISVSLDGSGSSDSDGSIASWVWTEDGQEIGTGETTSVNFKEGTHTIRLTVTDDGDLNSWEETTFIISPKTGGGGSGPDCSAKPNHPQCR